MIWTKTDAGRIEIQARALIKERAQRNLLLVIDGIKSDEMLLGSLAGISAADFQTLQTLGLITDAVAPGARSGAGTPTGRAAGTAGTTSTAATAGSAPTAATPAPEWVPLDYAQFTAALTKLISSELGLRGFVLTLAAEKAGTVEELQAVAQRTVTQIRERKGEGAANTARRALYGS